MKKITLSADEKLVEQARLAAHSRNKTLNSAFREWLENTGHSLVAGLRSTMCRLQQAKSSGPYTHDEMNER
jgi:hypothetical protein